jgi:hypothetical protein
MPALSQHACFTCRKVFKKPHEYRLPDKQGVSPARTIRKCPQCGGAMIYMGYKFRAPVASDADEWRRIDLALKEGRDYGIPTLRKQPSKQKLELASRMALDRSIRPLPDQTQPQILSPEDSAFWRRAYIIAFVDTSKDFYQRNIASSHQFSDGVHYTGYLWDCLRSPSRISIQRFSHEVVRYPEVFVMADDHSRDRIPGAPLWPYAPNSVARFEPKALLESLDLLPEDIYVFDSSVSWTLVLTHEDDGKRRICCAVGIET